MEFLPPWLLTASPWALVVGLVWLLATGRLTRPHTDRVEADADKRIAAAEAANEKLLKAKDEAHAAVIAAKDATAKELKEAAQHLQVVNEKAIEALEKIADAQEQSLKTQEIVKAVMQGLQNAARTTTKDPTGPVKRVNL